MSNLTVQNETLDLTTTLGPAFSLTTELGPSFQLSMGLERNFTLTAGTKSSSLFAARGQNFVHVQSTPATVWTIDHNLGFFPSVYVLDTAGDECEGDVNNVSLNRVIITFSAAFAGQARLI